MLCHVINTNGNIAWVVPAPMFPPSRGNSSYENHAVPSGCAVPALCNFPVTVGRVYSMNILDKTINGLFVRYQTDKKCSYPLQDPFYDNIYNRK